MVTFIENGSRVVIGDGNDFDLPREIGGRCGEHMEEKGVAGTAHVGLP